MILYRDGVEVGRMAKIGQIDTLGISQFVVGGKTGFSFDGKIDNVRIYNDVLDEML